MGTKNASENRLKFICTFFNENIIKIENLSNTCAHNSTNLHISQLRRFFSFLFIAQPFLIKREYEILHVIHNCDTYCAYISNCNFTDPQNTCKPDEYFPSPLHYFSDCKKLAHFCLKDQNCSLHSLGTGQKSLTTS